MLQPIETLTHTAFDGQVIFEVVPYRNLRVIILVEAIERGVPDAALFELGTQAHIAFTNFTLFLSRTVNIRFALKENAPPALLQLKAFWEHASQAKKDWAFLWEAFILMATYDIHDEWKTAVSKVAHDGMEAAPGLATPLPEEPSEVAALAENDPLPSKTGSSSTPKPSPSSEPKRSAAKATN